MVDFNENLNTQNTPADAPSSVRTYLTPEQRKELIEAILEKFTEDVESRQRRIDECERCLNSGTPREITSHKVNGLNEELDIYALDERGAGGASTQYGIAWAEGVRHDGKSSREFRNTRVEIDFQNGPITENGVNGISSEALLVIVEDRLAGFQSGPFACNDNHQALMHVRAALDYLHKRSRERIVRGVEGTNQV